MDNQEKVNNEHITYAIRILRNITAFAKVVPFVYAAVLLLCMLGYMLFDNDTAIVLDMMFYVSPLTCITFFSLSYILKFCNWYRLQCCLPMLPVPFTLWDSVVYEFIGSIALINYGITVVVFLLSLINAYFLFVRKCDCNCQKY